MAPRKKPEETSNSDKDPEKAAIEAEAKAKAETETQAKAEAAAKENAKAHVGAGSGATVKTDADKQVLTNEDTEAGPERKPFELLCHVRVDGEAFEPGDTVTLSEPEFDHLKRLLAVEGFFDD